MINYIIFKILLLPIFIFIVNQFFVKDLHNKTKSNIKKRTNLYTSSNSNNIFIIFILFGHLCYFFVDKIKYKITKLDLIKEIDNINKNHFLLYNYSELRNGIYLKELDKLNRQLKLHLLKKIK